MAAPSGVVLRCHPTHPPRPSPALRVAVVSTTETRRDPDENSGAPSGVLRGWRRCAPLCPSAPSITASGTGSARRHGWPRCGCASCTTCMAPATAPVTGPASAVWGSGCARATSPSAWPPPDRSTPAFSWRRSTGCPITSCASRSTTARSPRPCAAIPRPELADRAMPGAGPAPVRRLHDGPGLLRDTHWAADSIVADCHVPRERVHVIGIGRNHVVAPALDRDWDRPRFLFIGRDWKRKNGDAVVRAFREVRAKVPAAQLALVGGHPRIDSRASLATAAGPLAPWPAPARSRSSCAAPRALSCRPGMSRRASPTPRRRARDPVDRQLSGGRCDGRSAPAVSRRPRSPGPGSRRGDDGLADRDRHVRLAPRPVPTPACSPGSKVAERLIRALNPPGVDSLGPGRLPIAGRLHGGTRDTPSLARNTVAQARPAWRGTS